MRSPLDSSELGVLKEALPVAETIDLGAVQPPRPRTGQNGSGAPGKGVY